MAKIKAEKQRDRPTVSRKKDVADGSQKDDLDTLPELKSSDPSSMEILRAAQAAGAFDFWDNPGEDLYSRDDGEPA